MSRYPKRLFWRFLRFLIDGPKRYIREATERYFNNLYDLDVKRRRGYKESEGEVTRQTAKPGFRTREDQA